MKYYRPLAQFGPTRPDDALPIAGGWTWFTHAVRHARDAEPSIIPAADIPAETLAAITAPRPDIAGLSMASPKLMGILNTTPDSFSDGGRFNAPDLARAHAQAMIDEGAQIIDIGGESTRPGADFVPAEQEISRTRPVIEALRETTDIAISIDTRKADVAQAALDAGASMLNDVAGLDYDPEMAATAARSNAPICIMHAQGDPKTMQDAPRYSNVTLDVYDSLAARIDRARAAGINPNRIVIDPGIGFGKTQAHNLQILNEISIFHGLGCPILLGASRKRFIGDIGNAPVAADRAPGSIAVALATVAQGVQILRVHDIKETRQALELWAACTTMRR